MLIDHHNLSKTPYSCFKKDFTYKVYFLYFENKLVYIGKTMSIDARLRSHIKDKIFDSYSYQEFETEKEALKVERHNINHCKPVFNDSSYSTIICTNKGIFDREDLTWYKKEKLYSKKQFGFISIDNRYLFYDCDYNKYNVFVGKDSLHIINRDNSQKIFKVAEEKEKVIQLYPFLDSFLNTIIKTSDNKNISKTQTNSQKVKDYIYKHKNLLNNWEVKFINNVMSETYLTIKQRQTIRKLENKIKKLITK